MTARSGVAIAIVALLLGAGCATDDPALEPTPTATVDGVEVTPTASPTPAAACEGFGSPEVPAGAEQVDTSSGDVDGDLEPDDISLYIRGQEATIVRVEFAAGGAAQIEVTDMQPLVREVIRIPTAIDVDGDGDDEIWAVIGSGASTESYALFALSGCELVRPTLDFPGVGEQPNIFPVGGSVNFNSGLSCADTDADGTFDRVVSYSGERANDQFEIEERSLRLQGDTLVEVETRSSRVAEDEIDPYVTFSCGTEGE